MSIEKSNFIFLEKGTLVKLVPKKNSTLMHRVYVTKHLDPRMVKFVLGFHNKIIPISTILDFAKENDFNIHEQMQGIYFDTNTVGMVLSSFINSDDIKEVVKMDPDDFGIEKTVPIFFSGFCLLIEDKIFVIPGENVEVIS